MDSSYKLMELLDDEKKIIQAFAIDALGEIAKEYPEEVDISYFHRLTELLDSNDVNIQYETISAIDKIAETHPEKVINTSNKLIGLLRNRKGDIRRATSALEKIAKTNPKEAENISKELKELLNDENIANKEEIDRTLENIAKERREERKKENKIPFGLYVVLPFSASFGVGMLMISLTFFYYIPLYPPQYAALFFIVELIRSLGGFLLIISALGLWLQKKVAYWSLILAYGAIMFSGLFTNYIAEFEAGNFIPAGPGGFIPDFLVYGIIPTAIVFYMLAEKSKIGNWMKNKDLYQLEKLVGILSAFLAFFGIFVSLNYAIFFITALTIDSSMILVAVISIVDFLIAYFISFYVYDIITNYLIKKKLKKTF